MPTRDVCEYRLGELQSLTMRYHAKYEKSESYKILQYNKYIEYFLYSYQTCSL